MQYFPALIKSRKAREWRRWLAVLSLGLLTGSYSHAQTYNWNGATSGNQSFSAAANWLPGAPVSAATSVLNFAGAANGLTVNQDTGSPFILNSLSLNFDSGSGAFTLAGGPLNFQANGATQPTIAFESTQNVFISSAITNSANTLTIVGAGSAFLTLSGAISGSGGLTVNTSGLTAAVYLSGQSTYTGNTTVTSGNLVLASVNALGRETAVTTNSILVLNPGAGGPAGVPTGSFDQRLASLSGNANGRVNLGNAVLSVGFNDASTTFSGIISSAPAATGGLVKVGVGNLTLTGNNTFSSSTLIEAGGVTLSGANGTLASTAAVTVAPGANLTLNNATLPTPATGRLGDNTNINLRGGTLSMNGGTFTELAGALLASGPGSTLNIASGSTLSLTVYNPTPAGSVFITGGGSVLFRGGPPATVNGIIPSMVFDGNLATLSGNTLAPLGSYSSFSAGTATSNVLDASPTITVSSFSARNALVFPGTGAQSVQLDAALTLTAGAIHLRDSTITFNGANALSAGSGASLYISSASTAVSPILTLNVPTSAFSIVVSGGTTLNINRPVTLNVSGGVSIGTGSAVVVSNNGTTTTGSFPTSSNFTVNGSLDVSAMNTGLSIGNGNVLTGVGTVLGNVVIANNGNVRPYRVNGPARMTIQNLNLAPGGRYEWALNSVNGAVGTQLGTYTQSLIQASNVNVSALSPAARFIIRPLSHQANNSTGTVSDFNASQSYSWTLVSFSTLTGTFDPNLFQVDTTAFTNSLAGGTFSVAQAGSSIVLNFTPIPEPGFFLAGAALFGVVYRRRHAKHGEKAVA